MSALSASSRSAFVGPEPTSSDLARRRARTNRRLLVNGLRVAFAVVVLGFWEIGTTIDAIHKDGLWIDPFFYGRPSGIASQLSTWIQNGTAQGPLWLQIATTLEEAFLGFLIGVVLGVVFGVALVAAVVGEYLGAIHGIGLIIATAQATSNPNGVFAAMFILAVVALTAEVALTWLEGRLIKWRPNTLEVPRI